MYSKFLFAGLIALFAGMVWIGCDDNEDVPPDDPWLGYIQIVLGPLNDTLRFFDDDSVSTTVTIIVTDWTGSAYPGQAIHVTLSDPSLGVLEWADPNLQDTSNAWGRVNAVYHTYGITGNVIISATTGGVTDTAALTLQAEPFGPNSLTVSYGIGSNDTLVIPQNARDSVQVFVRRFDPNGNPDLSSNGIYVSSQVTGGLLGPFPPFLNGSTESWWVFHNDYGAFQLKVYNSPWSEPITVLPDTFVAVAPPTVQLSVTSGNDTLDNLIGDAPYFSLDTLVILVTDSSGQPLVGEHVDLSVNPEGLMNLAYLDPQLQDTTNAEGIVRVDLRPSYGGGAVTVCGEVRGVSNCLLVDWVPRFYGVSISASSDTVFCARDQYGIAFLESYDSGGIRVTAGNIPFPIPPLNPGQPWTLPWTFLNEYGSATAYLERQLYSLFFVDSVSVIVVEIP